MTVAILQQFPNFTSVHFRLLEHQLFSGAAATAARHTLGVLLLQLYPDFSYDRVKTELSFLLVNDVLFLDVVARHMPGRLRKKRARDRTENTVLTKLATLLESWNTFLHTQAETLATLVLSSANARSGIEPSALPLSLNTFEHIFLLICSALIPARHQGAHS